MGKVTKFPGFNLWSECMKGNPDSWAKMKKYNARDITLLERIYLRMRPWIKNHPYVKINPKEALCPKCSSRNVQNRGLGINQSSVFQKFQCNDCGGWGRYKKIGSSLAKN